MQMSSEIPHLIREFCYLSLLTIGGGLAAYPELERITVDVHHWLTPTQLIHLYSIGQVAPGPNMMMVASVGLMVAGFAGCTATVIAFFLPASLLAFTAGRVWSKLQSWSWHDSIKQGLVPVSIGLLLGGWITLAKHALTNWICVTIMLTVCIILLRTKINPTLLIGGGALIGILVLR